MLSPSPPHPVPSLNQSTYHANNEYCLLSDMEKGFKVMATLIDKLNT